MVPHKETGHGGKNIVLLAPLLVSGNGVTYENGVWTKNICLLAPLLVSRSDVT